MGDVAIRTEKITVAGVYVQRGMAESNAALPKVSARLYMIVRVGFKKNRDESR